jgi:hypothetical protein
MLYTEVMSMNDAFEAGKNAHKKDGSNPYRRGSDEGRPMFDQPTTSMMTGDNKACVTAVEIEGDPSFGRQTVRAYRGKENVGVLKVRYNTAEHIAVPSEDRRMGIGSMLGRVASFAAGRAGGSPIEVSSDRSKEGDAWAAKNFGEDALPERRPHFVASMDLKDIK